MWLVSTSTALRSSGPDGEHLFAPEREQLAREVAAAARRLLDLAQIAPGRAAVAGLGEQQVGVALDDHQDVVEVVGDAAGEVADGLAAFCACRSSASSRRRSSISACRAAWLASVRARVRSSTRRSSAVEAPLVMRRWRCGPIARCPGPRRPATAPGAPNSDDCPTRAREAIAATAMARRPETSDCRECRPLEVVSRIIQRREAKHELEWSIGASCRSGRVGHQRLTKRTFRLTLEFRYVRLGRLRRYSLLWVTAQSGAAIRFTSSPV